MKECADVVFGMCAQNESEANMDMSCALMLCCTGSCNGHVVHVVWQRAYGVYGMRVRARAQWPSFASQSSSVQSEPVAITARSLQDGQSHTHLGLATAGLAKTR
eukprot:8304175-Alexandrium_andersonii.AAC.1